MMLQNTCAILSGIAKSPELDLDDDEAKQIAVAYANVARHYNWVPNEKAADWYNLLTAVGGIMGAKIFAISRRKETERKIKHATKGAPVYTQPVRNATPSQPVAAAPKPQPGPIQPPPLMPAAEPDYSENTLEG